MDIKEILNKTDRFAANAGCRLTEVNTQHAVAEMTVTNAHLNGGNVCQGGALFTLADLARNSPSVTHGSKRVTCSGLRPSMWPTTIRFRQWRCA